MSAPFGVDLLLLYKEIGKVSIGFDSAAVNLYYRIPFKPGLFIDIVLLLWYYII